MFKKQVFFSKVCTTTSIFDGIVRTELAYRLIISYQIPNLKLSDGPKYLTLLGTSITKRAILLTNPWPHSRISIIRTELTSDSVAAAVDIASVGEAARQFVHDI